MCRIYTKINCLPYNLTKCREVVCVDDKKIGLFLIISAIAYFIYAALVMGHGIMFGNSLSTIVLLTVGTYFFIKKGG